MPYVAKYYTNLEPIRGIAKASLWILRENKLQLVHKDETCMVFFNKNIPGIFREIRALRGMKEEKLP